MRILGIDSSSLVASVAIVDDDILIAEYTTDFKKTHSQTLLPMIDEITRMTGIEPDTVDAIAVAGGPGSFTGLRIGSATAKGLALALHKPIVNVQTIDALAYNLYQTDRLICPIMDARRSQVYTGIFAYEEGKLVTKLPQQPMAVEELIKVIQEMSEQTGKGVVFVGDGIPVYRNVIDEKLQVGHDYAPAHVNRQRASSVAAMAVEYLTNGKQLSGCRLETAQEHKPDYLRLSQAEREKQSK